MKKLLLIDGNAIIHRAFHALPGLTNKDGQLANAVYGFFSMFLTILKDQKPDFVVVCFDRPKPTFRQELFAGYHENRPKMSDDLVPQIAVVHEVLEQMGVTIFEVDGYEGDDLIGTIATQAIARGPVGLHPSPMSSSRQGRDSGHSTGGPAPATPRSKTQEIEVLILTGDRDLLQLVGPRVTVLAPIVGVKTITVYNEQKVGEKYGVTPKQFIDYKALIGDTSDGYPGVTGIGPKTAASLINQFGTFENLYQHLGDVSPKISLMLATDAEQAALAKKLATIVTDAPIKFEIKKCACSDFDIENAKKAFEKLGFKSLVTRIETLSENPTNENKPSEKQEKNEQLGFL